MSAAKPELPVIAFATPEAWWSWLAEHHATAPGLWIRFARKASAETSIDHDQALDAALCFGWIDGQTRRVDDQHWVQRFTPRTARSKWSKVNCDRATSLIERRLMQPAGTASIEAAQADGRWAAAYAPPSTAAVPEDLARALDADPAAREFFATLSSHNRYAILYRVQDAKKPETRARRIEKYVAMLRDGERIHPDR